MLLQILISHCRESLGFKKVYVEPWTPSQMSTSKTPVTIARKRLTQWQAIKGEQSTQCEVATITSVVTSKLRRFLSKCRFTVVLQYVYCTIVWRESNLSVLIKNWKTISVGNLFIKPVIENALRIGGHRKGAGADGLPVVRSLYNVYILYSSLSSNPEERKYDLTWDDRQKKKRLRAGVQWGKEAMFLS